MEHDFLGRSSGKISGSDATSEIACDHWLHRWGRRERSEPGGSLAMEGKQLGSFKAVLLRPVFSHFFHTGEPGPRLLLKGGPFFPNRLFQTRKSCSIFIKAIFDIPVLGLHGRFSVDGTDLCTRGKRDSWTKF